MVLPLLAAGLLGGADTGGAGGALSGLASSSPSGTGPTSTGDINIGGLDFNAGGGGGELVKGAGIALAAIVVAGLVFGFGRKRRS